MRNATAFSEILRERRLAAGLTQEALAESAGVSSRAITELERGVVRAPRRDTLEMLADALGLPPDERKQWRRLRRQLSTRQPASKRPDGTGSELPAPPNPLIGRETEVRDLAALLRQTGVPIVSVTGSGGVGKTRVAIEAARQSHDSFRDGIVFVDLAMIRDHTLVAATIAQRLGFRDVKGREVHQQLRSFLAGRQILAILDNFEHLLPAAADIARLVSADSTFKLLVTSRARLRIQSEQEFLLTPLSLPDGGDCSSVDDIAGYAAIALFVQRGRLVKPDFELNAANVSDILEICSYTNGLPLAIELAAARIKLLTPQAMLPQLARGLTFLTGGYLDGPDRHRTMRGAIAWSYDLLDAAEQRLFCQLATFVGGWTLDATDLTNPADIEVVDGLAALLDNSLIYQTERRDGVVRFGMLETIREFGLERLEHSATLQRARDVHLRYFLALAETSEPHLRGPDQERWLDLIGADLANFRAALEWADQMDAGAELGLRLASSLSWFWFTRGYVPEGRRWLSHYLSQAPTRTKARMTALAGAGWLAHFQRDSTAALEFLEESLELARESGDAWYTAWTLYLIGREAYFDGDAARARYLGAQSLEIARGVEDDWLLAWPYHLLALADYLDADFAGARKHFETTLTIRRRINDQPGIATVHSILGLIDYREGRNRDALRLYRSSLEISYRLGARWFFVNVIANMVAMAARLNQLETAALLSGFVDDTYDRIGIGPIPIGEAVLREGLENIRRALAPDTFDRAWQAGREMTQEEAFDVAMGIGEGQVD